MLLLLDPLLLLLISNLVSGQNSFGYHLKEYRLEFSESMMLADIELLKQKLVVLI